MRLLFSEFSLTAGIAAISHHRMVLTYVFTLFNIFHSILDFKTVKLRSKKLGVSAIMFVPSEGFTFWENVWISAALGSLRCEMISSCLL